MNTLRRTLPLACALALAASLPPAAARADDWKLVWSDEFDLDGPPDLTRWGYEEGFVRNNEKQYYTRRNARVEGGVLVIEARKERLTSLPARAGRRASPAAAKTAEADYTSSSVTTEGKVSWTYGRFEVRAKIPTGRGTWPAIWMLGTNRREVGWPQCGEIDIMENVGFDPEVIHFNVHTAKYNHVLKTNKGAKLTVARPYADFHVYAVEWGPEKLDFFVDGTKTFTYANEKTGDGSWPFDKPQYLILNVAVGGAWGGQKGVDDSIFPQRMEVDYVRVYQKPGTNR
jgi:beta-glucanase (GH16 family)